MEFCIWLKKVLDMHEEDFAPAIDIYNSGEALCQSMQKGNEYDLIFLDIMLQAMNGVAAGKYIRENLLNHRVQIVYMSFNTAYALELFQNHPFDFLAKPFEKERVIKVVEKVIQQSIGMNQVLSLTSGRQKYVVRCKDIMYATSDARRTILHTTEREYKIYQKLGELLQ